MATTTVKNDAYNNGKIATINHGEGNGNSNYKYSNAQYTWRQQLQIQ